MVDTHIEMHTGDRWLAYLELMLLHTNLDVGLRLVGEEPDHFLEVLVGLDGDVLICCPRNGVLEREAGRMVGRERGPSRVQP